MMVAPRPSSKPEEITIERALRLLGMSKAEFARHANLDVKTITRALGGDPLFGAKAGKITDTVSALLKRSVAIRYKVYRGGLRSSAEERIITSLYAEEK